LSSRIQEKRRTYEGKEKQTEGLNRWFLEEWKNERGENWIQI
jgi:hypothetical protein